MAYSSYIFNLPNAWLARLIDILTPAHSTVLPQPYFISLSLLSNKHMQLFANNLFYCTLRSPPEICVKLN